LTKRIEETTDPEEKGRLKRFLEGALAVGREVIAEVLAKVVTGAAGV
jgi:hypothetical protein